MEIITIWSNYPAYQQVAVKIVNNRRSIVNRKIYNIRFLKVSFYLNLKRAVSVMPAMQVATAMRKVVVPSVEWTGTMEDLQEAVEEEQHISSRKLNRPETNWRRNMAIVASPSQLWML